MSILSDLARNRAVFAAITRGGEETRTGEAGGLALPEWHRLPRVAEAEKAAPFRAFAAEENGENRAEEPRRVIHTLGTIPEAHEHMPMPIPETAFHYPEPAERTNGGEGEGLVSDGAYRTLLRRFDQDARLGSQPAGEEGLSWRS